MEEPAPVIPIPRPMAPDSDIVERSEENWTESRSNGGRCVTKKILCLPSLCRSIGWGCHGLRRAAIQTIAQATDRLELSLSSSAVSHAVPNRVRICHYRKGNLLLQGSIGIASSQTAFKVRTSIETRVASSGSLGFRSRYSPTSACSMICRRVSPHHQVSIT